MPSPSAPFDRLRDFVSSKMRMSHVYQPLMLKMLIQNGGWASTRDIASSFLAQDDSQIDRYAEITKRMPGKVLGRHNLVEREGDGYRLVSDVQGLTPDERTALIRLCDEAVEAYRRRRGDRIYQHRRTALGDISGSERYEVHKRAGFRCGVSADERALEVDHFIPRRHGGSDDRSNLQALCWKCNANKGARDDTDFRHVREGMNARHEGCIFCHHDHRPKVAENDLAFAIRDGHAVKPLHTLVIPRRHAPMFFDQYEPERRALNLLLDQLRLNVLAEDGTVEGFNGIAGQTVMGSQVHLIPRRRGEVNQPRGGIWAVITGKASYYGGR